MAVVALSAFIGAVAYSAHRTQTVRAEVMLGLAVGRAVAAEVTATLERTREPPRDGAIDPPCNSGPAASRLIETVVLERGRVDVVFSELADSAIAGRQVSLTPYETASFEVVWICGNDVPGPGLNPLGFSAGGPRTTPSATTIEPRYLPRACR